MRHLLLLMVVLLLIGGCQREEPREGAPAEAGPAEEVPVAAPSEGPEAPSPLAALEQALEDEDWQRRLETAWQLSDRQDIAAPKRAELLLGAVEREVAEPTPGPPPYGTYLSRSEWLTFHYTRALGELGPEALEPVRRAVAEETGELRARALLALGYAGQREVVLDLREVLRTSQDGELRTDAAYLLGRLGAREAIPDLRQALTDPYRVTVESHHGRTRELYPVRDQALGALEELGLTVELTGEGEYRVVP